MLWLTLPALALIGFAWLLSLRGTKRDSGLPYRVSKHRLLVGFDALTEKQRAYAKILHLAPQNCVLYEAEIEVTSGSDSWFENWLRGDAPDHAALNGTSCIELKTSAHFPPESSFGSSISDNGKRIGRMEDFYDLNDLRKADGEIEFSVPLWWTREGKEFTRKLTKRILPANLKRGIQ